MSFDLESVAADEEYWNRIASKYKKHLLSAGWEGPIVPELLQKERNWMAMEDLFLNVNALGEWVAGMESDGGGIPGSADYANVIEFEGKYFVIGSFLNGGPFDTYEEAASEAGIVDE